MESLKIKTLLDHKGNTYPKYRTKRWYIINDQNNGQYGEGDNNDDTVKIDTDVVKPFLCDYADAYISVTGNITVEGVDNNTKAAFKNYYPFIKGKINLNNTHVDESDNLDLIMNMYFLMEYSDNYSDSTASLYKFKRQEPLDNNANLTFVDSASFKCKSNLLGNANVENNNAVWKNAKIIVPLKYISSFFRSLELPLIKTKLYIELNYTKNSVISDNAGAKSFKITKAELYVPVVTLNTEDNNILNKLLDTEFKRKVHWNEYKNKIETITQVHNDHNYKRSLLDAKIPGVNKLFVMGFDNNVVNPNANPIVDEPQRVKRDNYRKYLLPRIHIKGCNVLIDGRNFYDQNISDDFKKYEELRKVITGTGED